MLLQASMQPAIRTSSAFHASISQAVVGHCLQSWPCVFGSEASLVIPERFLQEALYEWSRRITQYNTKIKKTKFPEDWDLDCFSVFKTVWEYINSEHMIVTVEGCSDEIHQLS